MPQVQGVVAAPLLEGERCDPEPVGSARGCRFTPDELATLAGDLDDNEAAEAIGRTVEAVRTARKRYGYRDATGLSVAQREQRLEDLEWFVATGECAAGAAERLGIAPLALEKWCRNNALDLWHQLRARDPLPLDPVQAAKVAEARRKVHA